LMRSALQYLAIRQSTAAVTDRLRQSVEGVESAQRAPVIRALAQLEETQRAAPSRIVRSASASARATASDRIVAQTDRPA
jgi:hypothetical protein